MTTRTLNALRFALATAAGTACLFITDSYYGAFAADGYYGGFDNRSYVTGRPTLLPRYYNAGWADR